MSDTIDQKLGLEDRTVSRVLPKRQENPAHGAAYYRKATVALAGGDTATAALIEDGRGSRRWRIKLVYALASEGNAVLHSVAASPWKHIRGRILGELTRRQQAEALLAMHGKRVP